ncbi:hypothetical protein [Acetobacter sp.]|jgi:hypothetical protein|uniref:hypothetical protein n=1 Tax=Acetobacter sp. TaxID=440 RepID=UPI0025C44515|nr:hypothetical protein [Acetobacter sp.]MCH4092136.1 hypothetical protein [Acetobacter sp.]MCI1299947.1 hypothetical protein [Acetobacter sp.]MCI1315965.1 hypothetical protein [Acetobacter sp.]
MKPFDENGKELDSLFSVELQVYGFDLIIESRGGSDHGPNRSRNKQYVPAMKLYLSRMRSFGMIIQDIEIASRVAAKLLQQERRVGLDKFSLPLDLSKVSDIGQLRLSIGRASAAFGRADGLPRGNNTKRLRLNIRWPQAAMMTSDQIEHLLANPIDISTHQFPPKKLKKTTFDDRQQSINEIKLSVAKTTFNSNGQIVSRTVKDKELRMTEAQLELKIRELFEIQGDRCAITNLPFQFHNACEDTNLLPSLDRIDSNGHYDIDNLQLVCRFVNFWKQASDDKEFRRLIMLIRDA